MPVEKADEKRKRSRGGCHSCKRLKVKCNEGRPACSHCVRRDLECDYTVKLTWGGRPFKKPRVLKSELPVDLTGRFVLEGPTKGGLEPVVFPIPSSDLAPPTSFLEPWLVEGHPPVKQTSVKGLSTTSRSGQSESSRSLEFYGGLTTPDGVSQSQRDGSGITEIVHPPHPARVSSGMRDPSPEVLMKENRSTEEGELTSNGEGGFPSGENPKPESFPTPPSPESVGYGYGSTFLNLWSKLETGNRDLQYSELDDLFASIQPHPQPAVQSPSQTTLPHRHVPTLSTYSVDLAKVGAYTNSLPAALPSGHAASLLLFSPNVAHLAAHPSPHDDSEDPFKSLFDAQDPFSFFRSIPPTLSPLPEILLQVPYYREVFHFYTEVTAGMLVPAPAHLYKENPFKVILPRMAMQCPPILCAMLAFSSKHRSIILGQAVPTEVINQLISRSLNGLMLALQSESESKSDTTLATALLLLCYEVFSQNETGWKTHFVGARRIIRSRTHPKGRAGAITELSAEGEAVPVSTLSLARHGSALKQESNIGFFLIRWFAYIDVIGGLASAKPWRNPPGRYTSEEDEEAMLLEVYHREDEDDIGMSDIEDIDHFMGFDIKFVPILADIVALISQREKVEADEVQGTLPIRLVTRALETKRRLLDCYEVGEKRRERRRQVAEAQKSRYASLSTSLRGSSLPEGSPMSENSITKENVLRSTNRVFAYMGIVNLDRRVLCVPTRSTIVQNNVRDIIDTFRHNIPPGSNAEFCCAFALFTAGCEILDPEYREFIRERFRAMMKVGNIAATTAMLVIQQCWTTGKSWTSILSEQEIVLVFF